MGTDWVNKGAMTTTVVVAASDSLNKGAANYICDGVNDHVEIQAALDALPATGGEVFLLDGTYILEAAINLDSYQTLRGCGRNTILDGSADWPCGIYATGGLDTEKIGITIADLCLIGGNLADDGIRWNYVDYSTITNCWIYNFDENGIHLVHSDHNIISGNKIDGNSGNTTEGIYLYNDSVDNIVANNDVQGCQDVGIFVDGDSDRVTVTGNVCHSGNDYGIEVSAVDCIITGNVCEGNNVDGIYLLDAGYCYVVGNVSTGNGDSGIGVSSADYNLIAGNSSRLNATLGIYLSNSHHNSIVSNIFAENSQTADNTYDNISLSASDYNLIEANVCRVGTETNGPMYGIDISNATCDKNIVIGNDLHDGGKTANLNDAGTCTIVRDDNRGITPIQVKHLILVQNTSGGNLLIGNIVSYEAAAGAIGFETPTAIGDPKFWGMLVENINDTNYGYIQVLGGTTVMDATNVGGGAIAIGDLLCTEVGVRARKAAAGHMTFAIALELTNLADAVIDALIITPRQM